MLKKIIAVALALSFCLVGFCIPVSAAEVDNLYDWYDVLSLSSDDDTGNYAKYFTGSTTFLFDLPSQMRPEYADMVLVTTGSSVRSVHIGDVYNTSADSNLTVSLIGQDSVYSYWRVYGSMNSTFSEPVVTIYNNDSTVQSYVEIISFKFSASIWQRFDMIRNLELATQLNVYNVQALPGQTAKIVIPHYDGAPYTAFLSSSEWEHFDFIDFTFTCFVNQVDTISAQFGSIALPMSTVFWQDGSDTSNSGMNNFKFCIRVDVRGLNRDTGDVPMLIVSGMRGYEDVTDSLVEFVSCSGYVVTEQASKEYNIFLKIKAFFIELFGANPEESGGFVEGVQDKVEEMNKVNEGMQQLEKPDIDSIDVSLDNVITPSSVSTLTAPLASFFENPLLISIMLIGITLAFVSYVLYGKK